MRQILQSILLITAAVVIMGGKPAGKGSGGGTASEGSPVLATVRCPTTAECTAVDRIQGDMEGSYSGAAVYISDAKKFWLSTEPAKRTIFVDFYEPDGRAPCLSTSKGCRMNFTTASVTVPTMGFHINPVDEQDNELPDGLYAIPVGGSALARLKINFKDPSGRDYLWTIRFNPGQYAGSTHVRVTRVDDITWISEATGIDRARLVAINNKGKLVMTDEGLYIMPFRITIVKL